MKASRDVRLLFVTQGLEAVDAPGASTAGRWRAPRGPRSTGCSERMPRPRDRHVDLDPDVRDTAALAAVVHRELLDDGHAPEACHHATAPRLTPVLAEAPVPWPGPALTRLHRRRGAAGHRRQHPGHRVAVRAGTSSPVTAYGGSS
ncbi:hypothetical protein LV779_34680 [Streptomyces thinghirensis]|nr:hypothetical protein [Streptomyces thinghirensis]